MELFSWSRRNNIVRINTEPEYTITKFHHMWMMMELILPKEELRDIREDEVMIIKFTPIFNEGFRIDIHYNAKSGYANKCWDLSWDRVNKLLYQIAIGVLNGNTPGYR